MKQGKVSFTPLEKEPGVDEVTDFRPVCKYGANCYRKNPDHQKQYKHPREPNALISPPVTSKKVRLDDSHDSDLFIDNASEEIELIIKQADTSAVEPKEDELATGKLSQGAGASSGNNKACINYEQLLPSDNAQTIVKKRFFIELSKSCLLFWQFCQETNKESPCSALKELGMELLGPFQVLAAVNKGIPINEITYNCMEHRYYYDPPEVLTVIQVDKTKGSHIAYYTDHPLTQPNFIVLCPTKDNCILKPIGDNLFQAVIQLHQDTGLSIIKSLKQFATNHDIDLMPTAIKLRKKQVIADTFHGAGIVVPYDHTTELGYRPLNLTNTQLKTLLSQATTATEGKKKSNKLDQLQDLITYVQFANDEGDPGMGLELGIDLFCNGHKLFTSNILHLLTVGYDLLGREQYRWIIEEQMNERKQHK
ncbi:hypothetical protein LOD99_7690 [Oopsacas minuta]|uniref:PBZ-type domain-containing protein n=1 Tax=Oopsacas minuta TaxID=111878 RepID=A0AAV7JP25_9METZ|nr:hypothetical protein LOD99_7690 [Oopsacas minuta]